MIVTDYDDDKKLYTIKVIGMFNFASHKEFRAAYENVPEGATTFCVDMAQTAQMDSSALGMLLLFRNSLDMGKCTSNIVLNNANESVLRTLTISNFEQMFNIV